MACAAGPDVSESGLVLALDAGDRYSFTLTEVEVLVVAGGGGGGTGGGGGGAGGLIYNRNFSVTPGSAVTVTIGGGGTGNSGWGSAGGFGGNSVFGSLTAIGGGAGLHRAGATNSGTGGSGGGDAGGSGYTLSNATAGQGFSGGNSPENGTTDEEPGGGGGGAGGPGENASTPTASDNATVRATAAGAGGPGLGFDISGTFTYYAGGGGGSNRNGVGRPGGIGGGGTGGASPTAGSPNTGGGGGGTGHSGYGGGGTSAAGGSGIVIVRYPGPQRAIGGTVTFSGGHTIHTFTTVGSTTFTPLSASNGNTILGLSDLSNTGNFGTTVNSPTYSSANGGSVSFDGTDDYVTLSSSQIAPGTNAFTWNFWVKLNDLANFSIVFSGTGSNTDYGVIFMDPRNGTGGLGYYALGTRISDNNTTFGSNWWCITFVGSGGANGSRNLKLYRNAIQAGSTYTFDYNFTSTTPNIGANHSSYAELMRGNISNVSHYNRALSASEIQQNFNATRSRFGI